MTAGQSLASSGRALLPYLVTFAWAFAAFVAGQVAALAVLFWWSSGDIASVMASPYDGAVVILSVLAINPVMVAVLVLAVWIAGANPIEYLALVPPRLRAASIGVLGILVIIAGTDALLFVTGHEIVSPFQTISYTSATEEGWLPALWLATVIVAPAGEEIMFRGYLFQGFARSERAAWPAIVVISLLWASQHVQYDWTGMAEIFAAGLFLGWVRWRSGSTLLTFLLHGLFNLEGMTETLLAVRHVF